MLRTSPRPPWRLPFGLPCSGALFHPDASRRRRGIGFWRIPTFGAIVLLATGVGMAAAAEIPWATVESDVDTDAAGVVEVVAVDLDGDGDLDLAAVDGAGIETWLQTSGVWGAANLLRAGDTGRAIVAADFDGNGLPDLAIGHDAGALWFENGNGAAGTFYDSTSLSASVDVRDLAVGDLDGDGDLDLVGAVTGASTVLRFWENTPPMGEGSGFGTEGASPSDSVTWVVHDLASLADASGVAIADIDRDGDPDLVATADGSTDDLAWWENTAGDASVWTRRDVDTSFDGAHSPLVADFNGDGFPDLAAVGADGPPILGLWLNDGTPIDGGWVADTETTSGTGWLRASDIDADGDIDLAQATASRLDWWENAGDGTTFDRRAVATPGTATAAWVADFDRDGDLDLLAASDTDDDLSIWPAETLHRSAAFAETISLDPAFDGGRAVHAADLDGDGNRDVIAAAYTAGKVVWWQNDGSSFTPSTIDDAVPYAFGVRAADVDGDGDLDVLGALGRLNFATGTNKLVWWENDPLTRSIGWTSHDIGANINTTGGAADPWPVDMDGDGDLDVLLAAAGADRVAWWENTAGDGSAWTEHLVADPFNRCHAVVAADLDGDGDPDIVAAADTGDEIAWWENTGGGGGWIRTSIVTGWDGAYDVWVDDLDGDGDLDVLGASQFDDRISFWRNNGSGAFGSEETLGDPFSGSEGFFNQAYSVETADLDGDGDKDIVGAAYKDGGKITWWENTDGVASSWTRHDVTGAFDGASEVHVADVNGDGRPDILATAEVDDALALWLNGGGQFALPTTSVAPASLGNGVTETLFEIELVPRGLGSENDVELAAIELLLEETAGDPLTDAEANALIDSLELLADDGSSPGVLDGTDSSLALVETLDVTEGVQALVVPDNALAAAVAQGAAGTFFVRAITQADFESQSLVGLRVSHVTESSSRAEDRDNDIPLLLEWSANVATPTFPVADQADLGVSIEASDVVATAGGAFSWTVTVANAGPDTSTGTTLTLGLSGDASATSTLGCTEDPNGVPGCSLGSIGSGGQKVVTVNVSVDAMATGNIGLSASVSSLVLDTISDNDSDVSSIPVGESADLSVTLMPTSSSVVAGNSISWTVTVANAGPDTATAPTLTFGLTGEASFDSTSGCAQDPNGVPTCTLAALASGNQAQVTVTATTAGDAGGAAQLTASVASSTLDPNSGNDDDSDTVDVVASADVTVEKLGPANFEGGGSVSYTITVSNPSGPGTVSMVVSDGFPSLFGVGWSCTPSGGATCAASGSGGLAETVTLPPGGSVVFQASGTVVAGTTEDIVNTVTVTAAAGSQDSNTSNNEDSTTATWLGLFEDGFESGDVNGWSSSTPLG